MNIKGSGNKALDLDLLGQLALKQQSGNTISKTEVKGLIEDITADLKDEFSYSSRGLARAERAIRNTFELALESGWVRGEAAASMIESFIEADGSDLKDIVKEIRTENRRRPSSTSYSSYTPSYTPSYPTTSWGT